MIEGLTPDQQREAMELLHRLLRQEAGILGTFWKWVVFGLIVTLFVVVIGVAVWVVAHRRERLRWGWLSVSLLVGFVIAIIQAALLCVWAERFPSNLLAPFNVPSAGYLGPSGVAALFGLMRFGQKMLIGDLILAVLATLGLTWSCLKEV